MSKEFKFLKEAKKRTSHLKTHRHLKMQKEGSHHVYKFLMIFENRKNIFLLFYGIQIKKNTEKPNSGH